MPELPEVESLRRSLLPYILGQSILSIQVHRPKLVSAKGTVRQPSDVKVSEFIANLTGQNLIDIQRRAKNLIFIFESGKIMLVHLKMTGQLVYQERLNPQSTGLNLKSNLPVDLKPARLVNETGTGLTVAGQGGVLLAKQQLEGQKAKLTTVFGGHPIQITHLQLPHKHSHVIFELDQGTLYFNDTRMFGYLLYFDSAATLAAEEHFSNLGLDPLSPEFTLKYFKAALKLKKARLKTVLMGQEIVVGLGNIYCDEACFEAGVLPTRSCDSLSSKEVDKLHRAIVRILNLAVDLGGSSVANYLLADGSRGNYAREHKVYNRGGKVCLICGNTLHKSTINARTTVSCVKCQK